MHVTMFERNVDVEMKYTFNDRHSNYRNVIKMTAFEV